METVSTPNDCKENVQDDDKATECSLETNVSTEIIQKSITNSVITNNDEKDLSTKDIEGDSGCFSENNANNEEQPTRDSAHVQDNTNLSHTETNSIQNESNLTETESAKIEENLDISDTADSSQSAQITVDTEELSCTVESLNKQPKAEAIEETVNSVHSSASTVSTNSSANKQVSSSSLEITDNIRDTNIACVTNYNVATVDYDDADTTDTLENNAVEEVDHNDVSEKIWSRNAVENSSYKMETPDSEIQNEEIENTNSSTESTSYLEEQVEEEFVEEQTEVFEVAENIPLHDPKNLEKKDVIVEQEDVDMTEEISLDEGDGPQEVYIVQGVEDYIVVDSNNENDNILESATIEVTLVEEEKIGNENSDTETPVLDEKPLRKRKTKSKSEFQIPCHVLGRNIENPLEDPARNGRVPPKPRLGVKIPYRNLTSQIVSKQDIANEIMERSRQRNLAPDPPMGGDLFFAKKLTQRLARKLAPASSSNVKEEPIVKSNLTPTLKATTNEQKEGNTIANNSDLIAILEGDGDMDWTDLASTPVSNNQPTEKNSEVSDVVSKKSKEMEKQIALKQLNELPRRRKGHVYLSCSPEIKSQSSLETVTVVNQSEQIEIKKIQEVKEDLGLEPKFSSKLVTKTYTRKRKPSEDPVTSLPVPVKKTIIESQTTVSENSAIPKELSDQTSPEVYISKSSRIIKKKVIWDPDAPSPKIKSVSKSPKTSEASPTKSSKPCTVVNSKPIKQVDSPSIKSPTKLPDSNNVKSPKLSDSTVKSPKMPESKPLKQVETPKTQKQSDATTSSKQPEVVKSPQQQQSVEKISKLNKVREKTLKLSPKKIISKKLLVKKGKQKRLTEVDKLLMDEGAVNMLYAVKYTGENQVVSKPKKREKSVISLDKAQRELLNKTNEIRNDLQIDSAKESPKSLRRKDGSFVKQSPKDGGTNAMLRKKSKDSVHSPPASPGYAFTQTAEASRIIRRHSSSSFSSETSDSDDSSTEKQESSEETVKPKNDNEKTKSEKGSKRGLAVYTTIRSQKNKKSQQADKNQAEHLELRKDSLSAVDKHQLNEEMAKNFNSKESNSVELPDKKQSSFQTFDLRKIDNIVQIVLTPSPTTAHNILSVEVLTELCSLFKQLEADDTCHVIVVTSSGNSFCHGIDYKSVILTDPQEDEIVRNLAASVREFLLCLARMTKIIIAGVHGHAIGLGVTMLPLFDMVLASDTATFSTPYARLGCAPEGGLLLTLPNMVHNNVLISELFFASRKLTAAEALHHGLVTRTIWPDKFQEEILSISKNVANQSKQSMEAIKKQLRSNLLLTLEAHLNAENVLLTEHWSSSECQNNFKCYRLEDE